MRKDTRTVNELSDAEYSRYEQGDPGFEDITDNTIADSLMMMFCGEDYDD